MRLPVKVELTLSAPQECLDGLTEAGISAAALGDLHVVMSIQMGVRSYPNFGPEDVAGQEELSFFTSAAWGAKIRPFFDGITNEALEIAEQHLSSALPNWIVVSTDAIVQGATYISIPETGMHHVRQNVTLLLKPPLAENDGPE